MKGYDQWERKGEQHRLGCGAVRISEPDRCLKSHTPVNLQSRKRAFQLLPGRQTRPIRFPQL
uniref:Uncharacterized protein n=1 Tax=Rhizophora mucronata TaxID=61149 RepID=A0A2P2N511_RHIMU